MKDLAVAVAVLSFLASTVKADVGSTLEDCIKHYGKDSSPPVEHHGNTVHNFHFCPYDMYAFVSDDSNTVVDMEYRRLDRKELTIGEIARFFWQNGPDLEWILKKGG